MGLPAELPVVVAVLRFVERERPLDLLRAVDSLQQRNVQVSTILVGDGPQGTDIVDFVRSHNLQRVILPGFQILSDLPRFYAVTDMFVHPAIYESWGLSVNEAMACGLPVIASDRVGASYDLIRFGKTGLIYRAGDIDQLAACIEELCKNEEIRKTMGTNARNLVHQSWNYEKSVSALLDALEHFAH